MTTHSVPSIRVIDNDGHFLLAVTRESGEMQLALPSHVTTMYSAEQIAAEARGALADAHQAGREEVEAHYDANSTEVGEQNGELRSLFTQACDQRDALAESVEQLRAELEQANGLTTGAGAQLVTERDEARAEVQRLVGVGEGYLARINELEGSDTDGLRDQLQARANQITALEARINAITDRNLLWERSFNMVGERMMTEAVERGYCETYDEIVDDLNRQLPIGELPTRSKSWTAEITISIAFDTTHGDDEDEIVRNIAYAYETGRNSDHDYEVTSTSSSSAYEN